MFKFKRHGHGNTLVQWLIDLAKEKHCDEMHLDSGPQRHDAHRLYLKHKMKIIGTTSLWICEKNVEKTRNTGILGKGHDYGDTAILNQKGGSERRQPLSTWEVRLLKRRKGSPY